MADLVAHEGASSAADGGSAGFFDAGVGVGAFAVVGAAVVLVVGVVVAAGGVVPRVA